MSLTIAITLHTCEPPTDGTRFLLQYRPYLHSNRHGWQMQEPKWEECWFVNDHFESFTGDTKCRTTDVIKPEQFVCWAGLPVHEYG